MTHSLKFAVSLSVACLLAVSAFAADNRQEQGRGQERAAPQAQQGERHEGPKNYQRPQQPKLTRPVQVNRGEMQHNYQAARSYKIGPYHPPAGWAARRWAYGQILPRAYWAPEYLIADYWLFGLEVPPAGYEWVRDGADAILVSTVNGEILQVEYGVFA